MKDVIIALDFPGREETMRFLGLFGGEPKMWLVSNSSFRPIMIASLTRRVFPELPS